MNKHPILAALVALVVLTGCATTKTETIYVQPQCALPPLPVLPVIDWAELQGTDSALDRLEEYEALLVDALLEHRAMLGAICNRAAD